MTHSHAPESPFHIRRADPADADRLVDIWWRSAAATHGFLSPAQLDALLPDVQALQLERLDTWVLCTENSDAVGFLVMDGHAVDSLFIAPEWLRLGGGALLIRKAREARGPLRVDVNEQNVDALRFYQSQGFAIVGRSPVDDAGRAYPLLHLEEQLSPATPTSSS